MPVSRQPASAEPGAPAVTKQPQATQAGPNCKGPPSAFRAALGLVQMAPACPAASGSPTGPDLSTSTSFRAVNTAHAPQYSSLGEFLSHRLCPPGPASSSPAQSPTSIRTPGAASCSSFASLDLGPARRRRRPAAPPPGLRRSPRRPLRRACSAPPPPPPSEQSSPCSFASLQSNRYPRIVAVQPPSSIAHATASRDALLPRPPRQPVPATPPCPAPRPSCASRLGRRDARPPSEPGWYWRKRGDGLRRSVGTAHAQPRAPRSSAARTTPRCSRISRPPRAASGSRRRPARPPLARPGARAPLLQVLAAASSARAPAPPQTPKDGRPLHQIASVPTSTTFAPTTSTCFRDVLAAFNAHSR